MEACRLGAYRIAHRVAAARRHERAELAVREALVRTRTRYIAVAKTLVRRDGLRVAASESHLVAQRIAALELSPTLSAELLPLFQILAPINDQIDAADRRIAALVSTDPAMRLLATAPSIGPITASAIVATADDMTRFASAHRFEAFFGLVPGERIAVVAIARRLAGIVYAMWRDGVPYDAARLRAPASEAASLTTSANRRLSSTSKTRGQLQKAQRQVQSRLTRGAASQSRFGSFSVR